jgi:hypothetical protein
VRNDVLRAAMRASSMTADDLAAAVGVDPKTCQRWVSRGRLPHPRHRRLAAAALGEDEGVLWPAVRSVVKIGAEREVLGAYPHRSELPRAIWRDLIERAQRRVWCAGYTSYFLWTEVPDLVETLADKQDVRFVLGDPDSPVTAQREAIENAALTVTARISMTRAELAKLPNAQVRYSDRHISLSVWVFDDDMIVCTHLSDLLGHDSPTMHIRRRTDRGLFDRYAGHFTYLWETARHTDG